MAAVLFDMDGTLIDSITPIRMAIGKTLEEFGYGPLEPREIKYFVGTSLSEALKHWTPDPAPMVMRYQEIYIQNFAGGCTTFPGIVEMLDALQGKLDMGIITLNANHEAGEVLRRVGLIKYFDFVFGDDAQRSPYRIKPHPQHYFYALNKMGIIDDARYDSLSDVDDILKSDVELDTHMVVHVGDAPQDMIGSNRAGITAIGAAWRKDRPDIGNSLLAAGAEIILSEPGDLIGYLKVRRFL